MKTVMMLCFANIRKKKLQNLSVMILMLLSTLLIATATAIILNAGDNFTKLHSKTNGSHQIMILDQGYHEPHKVYQWWANQQGVTSSNLLPFKTITEISYKNEKIQNRFLYMIDTPNENFKVDKLIKIDGKETLSPPKGTIWIPTALANANGIKVGDSLDFSTGTSKFTAKVAEIVIDLPYCAPFSNGVRIWMNTEDYASFLGTADTDYMFGLRFDNYEERSTYWKQFEDYLGTPYLENINNFEDISGFYYIMNQFIGAIMILLGFIMVIIALFTIKYTISDAILSDYKSIGIIKSVGLSLAKIKLTYVLQFFLVSLVGIFIGVAGSIVISGSIIESSQSNIRMNSSGMWEERTLICTIVGILVLIVVILFSDLQIRVVRQIQPAQAIRFGASESKNNRLAKQVLGKGIIQVGFEKYPISFVIGFRNLLKNKKSAFLILILTIMTSAVMMFGSLLLYSIANLQNNAPQWGYDSSDISVTVFNKAGFSLVDFEAELSLDDKIKNVERYSSTIGSFQLDRMNSKNKELTLNINIDIIDGSYDDMGAAVMQGRNPVNQNEIALGVNVAKKIGKELGDISEVYIRGNKQKLTIVGIYQSIANRSNSARVTVDVMKNTNESYDEVESYFINLKNNKKADEFVRYLNSKYKDGITAATQKELIDGVVKEVVEILVYPMIFLGLLFGSVLFTIIYSACRINVQKDSKNYGIFKSIGLTTQQIRLAVTGGIAGVAALGSIIGLLVGIFVFPSLIELKLVDYGLVKLPLQIHPVTILIVIVVTIMTAGMGAWFSSTCVQKTSPRILVIE